MAQNPQHATLIQPQGASPSCELPPDASKGARNAVLVQVGVFLAFIFTDVGKVLAFSWAVNGTPISTQTLVIMNSAISIVIGLVISSRDGAKMMKECLNPIAISRFFFVAMLFSLNQTLGALQYTALSAATAKVLAQVRLPILALGSYFVMKKIYTLRQWGCLFLVTGSAILFCAVKSGDKTTGGQLFGYVCSIAASLCTVIAGLFSEKFLKASKSTPFYTQKVQLEVGGLVVAVVMLFFMPWFAEAVGLSNADKLQTFHSRTEFSCINPKTNIASSKTLWGADQSLGAAGNGCTLVAEYAGAFFDGWVFSTWFCLLMLMAQSWMAGFIAKIMSQVMKQLGQCLSLLLCYFLGDCLIFRKSAFSPTLTACSFLVVGCLAAFLTSPSHKAPVVVPNGELEDGTRREAHSSSVRDAPSCGLEVGGAHQETVRAL